MLHTLIHCILVGMWILCFFNKRVDVNLFCCSSAQSQMLQVCFWKSIPNVVFDMFYQKKIHFHICMSVQTDCKLSFTALFWELKGTCDWYADTVDVKSFHCCQIITYENSLPREIVFLCCPNFLSAFYAKGTQKIIQKALRRTNM